VGHRLAALMRRAERASNLVERDPAAARAQLGELAQEARAAVEEVRGIAHALNPPELELLGLVGALRERARQYVGDGPRVTVEAREALGPLPAAVEAAAYYIAREALTNVQRHAAARSCRLALRLVAPAADAATLGAPAAPWLELEVVDDGRGLPAAGVVGGLGLRSMRERAAAVGGTLEVASTPGQGTRIRVRVPRDGR
jgi:signal transduction histidine kinase